MTIEHHDATPLLINSYREQRSQIQVQVAELLKRHAHLLDLELELQGTTNTSDGEENYQPSLRLFG